MLFFLSFFIKEKTPQLEKPERAVLIQPQPVYTNQTKTQAPILACRKVKAGYNNVSLLSNINFDVSSGEIHGLLGGSGSGKSTLLNHILGLYPLMGGEITLLNSKITPESSYPEELRKKMGVLFQSGALLSSLTVAENIALPLIVPQPDLDKNELAQKIEEVLNRVKLNSASHKFPSELSGGMKKRAALARALITNPSILFCDEPSAGLDPSTSRHLDELFLELRDQGKTLVVVTHELASIKAICNSVTFLNAGGVIASGPLAEVEEHTHPALQSFFRRTHSYIN